MSRLLVVFVVLCAGIVGYRFGKRSSMVTESPQMKALNGNSWRWKPVVLISEKALQTKLPLFVQQEDESGTDVMDRYSKWAAAQTNPLDAGGRIIARNPKWENGEWAVGYPPFKYWNQQDFGGTMTQAIADKLEWHELQP